MRSRKYWEAKAAEALTASFEQAQRAKAAERENARLAEKLATAEDQCEVYRTVLGSKTEALRQAQDAIERARKLHTRVAKVLDDEAATKIHVCLECDYIREIGCDEAEPVLWPCATALALDGQPADGGEQA
jgi:flagellar motor switch protein FliG